MAHALFNGRLWPQLRRSISDAAHPEVIFPIVSTVASQIRCSVTDQWRRAFFFALLECSGVSIGVSAMYEDCVSIQLAQLGTFEGAKFLAGGIEN